MVCRDFILPEPASYVFFYAVFNLRNLLYIIALYTNFTFPQYGVRYIAINDNFDTINPNSTDNETALL